MSRFAPRRAGVSLFALACCVLLNGNAADKTSSADTGLIQPIARRLFPLKDFEYTSHSPFGGSRSGGIDNRHYALSPDGKRLATLDAGLWQIEMWDVENAKSLGRFGRFGNSAALAFSPDGKRLFSVGGGSWSDDLFNVESWDVARRRLLRSLDEGVNLTPFGALAVSPDGKILALVNLHGGRQESSPPGIHFWEAATGDEIRQFALTLPETPPHGNSECALVYAPSGRMLALVVERRVCLIEARTGKERSLVTELPQDYLPRLWYDREGARAVAFSPDGKTLALGCTDGFIRLFDVATGKELEPLIGHKQRVEALRFTAPNTLLSLGFDKALLTWSLADARRVRVRTPAKLTEVELEQYWDDLRSDDARKAYLARRTLAAVPTSSLPFLSKRLSPVAAVNMVKVEALLNELRTGAYPARRKAAAELVAMGEDVLPVLSGSMNDPKRGDSPVVSSVMSRLRQDSPSPNRLSSLKAVRVLEQMEGDEPRKLLAALAKGMALADLTIAAKAAQERIAVRHTPSREVTIETLWKDLGQEDARVAFTAIRELTARPKASVPFLTKQLLGLAKQPDDEQVVAKRILELAEEEFAKRDAASKALREMGPEVVPALQAALKKSEDLEQKRRLESVLDVVKKRPLSLPRLQADRALEVLHALDTDDARQTLAELAKTAQPRWLRECAASLVGPAK